MTTETISVTGTPSDVPIEGESTRRLGEYLVRTGELPSDAAFDAIKQQGISILQRCMPLNHPSSRTGIVVGYVQSGKTMSMTTVACLARDNGCRLIIVLAGVTVNLLRQSRDRFIRYLRSGGTRPGDWRMIDSEEGIPPSSRDVLAGAVAAWRDDELDETYRKPLFFTVMKHHQHLDALSALLSAEDLTGIPTLIIDDEADQAGLNTRPTRPVASTTYLRIRALRATIPNHTYLQYTATPQAPLLISLADMLSPDFAEVIDPGADYVGGETFFGPGSPYVRRIPPADLFPAGSPPQEPPRSLIQAMALYFVGLAGTRHRGDGAIRSMLVHPSQRKGDHRQFARFVRRVIDRWVSQLGLPAGDPDKADVVRELEPAHMRLLSTNIQLPPLSELLHPLRVHMRSTVITEVNSEDGNEVDWDNADSHILIGGEKLNRGYTVKGLTVTYMPRNAGGWNADTIQQRARFFGYKGSYLGDCCAYLHPDIATAYEDYVTHEQDVRKQLRGFSGRPLREWKRAFFLDSALRPTRINVLHDPYYTSMRIGWFQQSRPHADQEMLDHNRRLIRDLVAGLRFEPYAQYQRHGFVLAALDDVFAQLLVDYRVSSDSDVVGLYSVRCWIRDLIESDPSARVALVRMLGMDPGHPARQRTPDQSGRVQLHEGRRAGPGGYPGDGRMREDNCITIQLHRLHVTDPAGTNYGDDIHAIAVWVPDHLKRSDVLVRPGARAA